MNKLLLLLVLFLAGIPLAGQVDSTTIPIVSYWNSGDVYEFRITEIQQQQGAAAKNDTSSYTVSYECALRCYDKLVSRSF